MKKTQIVKFILMNLLATLTLGTYAQKTYMKLNVGYNFGTQSTIDGADNETKTGTVTNYEKVDLKFGKGFNFGGTFGYMFNEYLGSELHVNYFLGEKTSNSNINVSSSRKTNYAAKMLSFTPSFILTPGYEKINPYAKLGLIMGMATIITETENLETSFGTTTNSIETLKENGGFAFGFLFGLGVDYKINDQLSIFGELNSNNISYSPKKGEIIEAKENGTDILATLTTREKKVEYAKSYSEDTNSSPDNNKSRKDIAKSYPFNSLGLNLGVKYRF